MAKHANTRDLFIEAARSGSIINSISVKNSRLGYKHDIPSASDFMLLLRIVFERTIAALHLKAQLARQAKRPIHEITQSPTHSPATHPALTA